MTFPKGRSPACRTLSRPLAGVGNVYLYESSGVFNMSRVEVMGSTRFNSKVSLNAAYGLGRARSDTDGVNSFPADPYDLGGEYGLPESTTYGLFVVNRDGTTEQVGTWRALRGRTMQLTAGTASRRSQISSVEVRTADGRPVLKLT